jgi:FHA domain/zinc-ribbon domain
MDRQAPAQVALTVPPDFARIPAAAGAVPAVGTHPRNGRLGDLMPSVYCTGCGEANPEGARFCSHCGTPLLRRPGERAADTTSTISLGGGDLDAETGDDLDADAAAVAALPPGTALLAVRRGPNAGSRFLLDSDLTLVGRHPDSDIFLDDVTVSRRHAEFYRQGGGFTVRDVGSLNGTYVNRERIEEASLNEGDEVQVGKFRLVFLLGPRSQAEYGSGGSQVGG